MKKQEKEFTEKYNLVTVEPGLYDVAGFGRVDLINLSMEEADGLFKAGFPFLEKKKKSDPPVVEP